MYENYSTEFEVVFIQNNPKIISMFLVVFITICGVITNLLVILVYKLTTKRYYSNENIYNVQFNFNANNPNAHNNSKNQASSYYCADYVTRTSPKNFNSNQQQQQQQQSQTAQATNRKHTYRFSNGFMNKLKFRRTLCTYFILTLSICDLFICLVNIPMEFLLKKSNIFLVLTQNMTNSDSLHLTCKFLYFFYHLPIIFEIEILLVIAIDRYQSIYKPFLSHFFDTTRFILIICVQCAVACTLSLPNFLFIKSNADIAQNASMPDSQQLCVVNYRYEYLYDLYEKFLFSVFLLNLLIISVCYVKVYKHIYEASTHQKTEAEAKLQASTLIGNTTVGVSDEDALTQNGCGVMDTRQSVVSKGSLKQFFQKKFSLSHNDDSINEAGQQQQQANKALSFLKLNDVPLSISPKETPSTTVCSSSLKTDSGNNNTNANAVDCVVELQTQPRIKIVRQSSESSKMRTQRRTPNLFFSFDPTPNSSRIQSQLRRLSVPAILTFYSSNTTKTPTEPPPSSQPEKSFKIPNEIFISSKTDRLFRRHINKPFKHSKTARILGISTLTFTLTWIPYWYVTLFYGQHDSRTTTTTSRQSPFCVSMFKYLFYLNYILNPVFYSFFNQRFRLNFFNLLFNLKICCSNSNKCINGMGNGGGAHANGGSGSASGFNGVVDAVIGNGCVVDGEIKRRLFRFPDEKLPFRSRLFSSLKLQNERQRSKSLCIKLNDFSNNVNNGTIVTVRNELTVIDGAMTVTPENTKLLTQVNETSTEYQ